MTANTTRTALSGWQTKAAPRAFTHGCAKGAGRTCSAELVLDTEAAEWGGAHKGRRKLHFHTTDGGVYGRDYTLTVDLPAMGSFLLRLTPEAPNPDAARISANKAMAQKRRTARAKNSSK